MSKGPLLALEPDDELKFHFEPKKQLSCTLHLINKTDKHVAFKVLTTSPKKYCVRPNKGVLPPSSTLDVIVTMQAQKEIPTEMQSKDKFKIRSFITTSHHWKDGFQWGSGNGEEEYKLKVRYVLHSQPLVPQIKDTDGPHAKMMAQKGEVEAALHEAIEQFSTLNVSSFDQDCTIRDLEDKLKAKEEIIDSLRRELQELRQKQNDRQNDSSFDQDFTTRNLEGKTKDTEELIDSLRKKLEESRQKLNDEQKKVDDLKRIAESLESIFRTPQYSQFSYVELQEATNDFDNSTKIGEGGYGSVYKGFLRHTSVAIKKLDSQSMQGLPEFYQEVDILTKVRHPNLINLMGACSLPEPCLVYEFLPNGSLEDRLSCEENTPPLCWQARIRIITEICSALIFLHSQKPHSVVHGDLKPSNILLDANLVTKLGDFGICRLLTQSNSTTKLHHTEPKGTFPYIDPEFGHTGELTSSSDIYSFGIIILQLLTRRPALGVVKAVQDALTSGTLHNKLDESAGQWPYLQANILARLGVECCKINRWARPRLETDMWRVLEPMVRASSLESWSLQLKQDNKNQVPSHFLCPILQEVMNDPQVAADGFTYEAEAIKGWFDGGHNTSPMTNLELPHQELLPNHALHSMIQEWLQQKHQP